MADRNLGVGQTYTTLNAALNGIGSGDRVVFKDNLGDNGSGGVFVMSQYVGTNFNITNDFTEDPDQFPQINHTSTNYYNAFNAGAMTWEKFKITSNFVLNTSQANVLILFNRIVFNGGSAAEAFTMGANLGTRRFQNCLFTSNTHTQLFTISNYGASYVEFYNCTFDDVGTLLDADLDNSQEVPYTKFQNCIFTGTWTAPGNNWRGITTYSLTSEALTGYGTGCVSDTDPGFQVASPTTIAQYQITSTSSAKAIGLSTNAPTIDIANNTRSGDWDAGVYIFSGGTPPTTRRRIIIT